MKMKHKIIALLLSVLIFCLSCSSVPYKVVKKEKSDESIKKYGFAIQWDTTYVNPSKKKGFLVVTNPETKKSFKISYDDFFVMKKAYSNWRVVEKTDPVITGIQEKDGKIYVTFNYIENTNKSILAGVFIVDLKYIKNEKEEKNKIYLYCSGALNVILTIIIIAIIL